LQKSPKNINIKIGYYKNIIIIKFFTKNIISWNFFCKNDFHDDSLSKKNLLLENFFVAKIMSKKCVIIAKILKKNLDKIFCCENFVQVGNGGSAILENKIFEVLSKITYQ